MAERNKWEEIKLLKLSEVGCVKLINVKAEGICFDFFVNLDNYFVSH